MTTPTAGHRTSLKKWRERKLSLLPMQGIGQTIIITLIKRHTQSYRGADDDDDDDASQSYMQWQWQRGWHDVSVRACYFMNRCLNGGTCVDDLVNLSFNCTCPPQFSGLRCEHGQSVSQSVRQCIKRLVMKQCVCTCHWVAAVFTTSFVDQNA